jgi:hypothetical protein
MSRNTIVNWSEGHSLEYRSFSVNVDLMKRPTVVDSVPEDPAKTSHLRFQEILKR